MVRDRKREQAGLPTCCIMLQFLGERRADGSHPTFHPFARRLYDSGWERRSNYPPRPGVGLASSLRQTRARPAHTRTFRMSADTPSGGVPTSVSPTPEADSAVTVSVTGLRLPDPKPDGTNPFLVIDWILFTAYVAARHLTDARQAKVGELGRKMRTEDRDGVLFLHWEDDVDRRAVERELGERICERWWGAHTDARKLSAGIGIPFNEYDPVLKSAWDKVEDAWQIIWGNCSSREFFGSGDIAHRLHELAHSTTPAIPSARPLPKPVAPLTGSLTTQAKQDEGAKAAAVGRVGRLPNTESKVPKRRARMELYKLVHAAMRKHPSLDRPADLLAHFRSNRDFREKLEKEAEGTFDSRFFTKAKEYIQKHPDAFPSA